MNRSALYFIIGALIVGAGALGYLYYEESQSGVDIEISEDGVSID